tara:strand:- start:111 stop:1367 length:1257 start_codon:yes stop_codon:yes gene_type:complete
MSLISLIANMNMLVGGIGPKFISIGKSAIQAFKDMGQFFHDKFIQPVKNAVDALKENWTAFKEMVGAVFTGIGEIALSVLGGLWDLIQEIPSVFTIDFWTGLFTSIGETVVGWLVAVWDLVPDVPDVFTKQYWVDLFDFEMPSWGEIFEFALPDWLLTTVDFILGNGAFAGFSLSERLDFAFDLPDWLTTTIDFMTGDGAFAGFSIGDRIDLMIGEFPQPFKFIADLFQGVFDISIGDFIDFGIDLVGDSWDFIKNLVTDPLGVFADVGTGVLSFFTDLGVTLGDVLKAPLNFLIESFNSIMSAISFTKTLTNPITGTEYTFGLDLTDLQIPALAKGGIVNKPTLAMIGEDGPEAVVPLSQRNNPSGAGMGGGTVNVTVNASGITDRTDKRALAREIGNMIQQEMARNIGGSTMRGRY